MSTPSQTLSIGTTLGPYSVVRKIGEGGMGEVYEARDERLHRNAVIKIIGKNASNGLQERAVASFLREARALAQLSHPNVVTIYSIDKIGELDYIAMEFIHGADLRTVLKNFTLSAAEAAPLLLQLLEGLEALHASGILHRDLKPANLILNSGGQIKMLDFGVAKFIGDENLDKTSTAIFEGTLVYSAPELTVGIPASKQSDLWALGAVFYECMVGRRLIDSPAPDNLLLTLEYIKIAEPKIPAECEAWIPKPARQILQRLIAKDPAQRYPSAEAAALDVRAYIASLSPAKNRFYRTIGRPLKNGDAARRRAETNGFSNSQSRRIVTLAAVLQAEKNPIGELSSTSSGVQAPVAALTISDESMDQSIVQFKASYMADKERTTETIRLPVSKKLDYGSVLQSVLGLIILASAGLLIWTYTHSKGKRVPAAVAVEAEKPPAAIAIKSPPQVAPRGSSPIASKVTSYRGYAIEMDPGLEPGAAANLLVGIENQLNIFETAALPAEFYKFARSIPIRVSPGLATVCKWDKEASALLVSDKQIRPEMTQIIRQYMNMFYDSAPPGILNRDANQAFFFSAMQKQIFPNTIRGLLGKKVFFSTTATAFLRGHDSQSGLTRPLLQKVQPEYIEFLDKTFSNRTNAGQWYVRLSDVK